MVTEKGISPMGAWLCSGQLEKPFIKLVVCFFVPAAPESVPSFPLLPNVLPHIAKVCRQCY